MYDNIVQPGLDSVVTEGEVCIVFELEVALIPNTGFESQYQAQYYHNNPKLSDRSVYSRQTVQEKQSDLFGCILSTIKFV